MRERSGDFLWWTVQDSNSTAERSEGNQSPGGALVSARFPTRRNVYRDAGTVWGFFVVDGTGLEQGGSAVSGLQISLYRRCSFLDGCGILGLVQQIIIYKGEY